VLALTGIEGTTLSGVATVAGYSALTIDVGLAGNDCIVHRNSNCSSSAAVASVDVLSLGMGKMLPRIIPDEFRGVSLEYRELFAARSAFYCNVVGELAQLMLYSSQCDTTLKSDG
jgi:hypothetical protein